MRVINPPLTLLKSQVKGIFLKSDPEVVPFGTSPFRHHLHSPKACGDLCRAALVSQPGLLLDSPELLSGHFVVRAGDTLEVVSCEQTI